MKESPQVLLLFAYLLNELAHRFQHRRQLKFGPPGATHQLGAHLFRREFLDRHGASVVGLLDDNFVHRPLDLVKDRTVRQLHVVYGGSLQRQ